MDVTPDLVRHVASLARLDLTDAEVAAMVGDLSRILHHVEAVNRVDVSQAEAAAQAEAVDARKARGERIGPLAGVPLAVKDNLEVEGVPMTCGSRILRDYVPPRTATSVARAVLAGACVVGKTNLDEFAMGSSTENS